MNYYNDFDMNQTPSPKFWRPNEWNASLVQPKKWWYFGVIGPIMALMLIFVILGSYFLAQPEDGSGKKIEAYVCLIFFGSWGFLITLILMIYFLVLWIGRSEQAFKTAKVFFIISIVIFPFMLIWCSVLNGRMDPPEPEEVFNPYSAANGYGFNPAWGSQTRTFALTGQYTGSYSAQPQPDPYGPQQPFGQQPNPQATGMFNVPPRGPQPQPQPQPNPYGPQQPTGMFNAQPQQPFGPQPNPQATGMFNVPPRGPQPNPYGPQQPSGMFNTQPQQSFGPQPNPQATGMFNVPPRGPQPQPNPYGPQQPTGMFNVPPRGPQPNPYGPQQPTGMFNVPPRGPQFGPQQPNPYGPQQSSGMFPDPNMQNPNGFNPR
ncbi:hypothetical protein NPA07_04185 [Mycoplasmopsis caviae]|uniref:Uncharacterized protein n=1 Tax=Mycoplasmopsis caviae TaxID=55603 RepID=A0A3P8MER8_9BACT|nr:hypothetical protein [Mycoplasmopsis caviae]UUD34980.1 hypothetical protein NPA07_04185 [Mycoplasmopsis caviae]VDR42196.1 Uncharacterised protein [Mycoplasmopsis caviae]